jgi:hypothetical protein
VRAESCTCALLSIFISEKSGAGLPTCNVPARARIHSVSNGKTRKGTGPAIFAITRPNCSGDCRITLYSATQPVPHSAASTQIVATTARTSLDFVLTRSTLRPQKRSAAIIKSAQRSVNSWNVVCPGLSVEALHRSSTRVALSAPGVDDPWSPRAGHAGQASATWAGSSTHSSSEHRLKR